MNIFKDYSRCILENITDKLSRMAMLEILFTDPFLQNLVTSLFFYTR